MADDGRRDAPPTIPGRGGRTEPQDVSPAQSLATVRVGTGDVAPLHATLVPATSNPAPRSAPPELPAEDRYTIGVEIARGGMGRVVEAFDTLLGRTVALKVALSLDADAMQRFHRETRITARLEHPSIVPVHDAGIGPGGAPFYVMRKISGRPLETLVGEKPELGDRLALLPSIVAAAHAVAHAHARGIVHRDIKPANILVGDLGETIVIDWGIAKAIGEPDDRAPATPIQIEDSVLTRAGVVYGTPGFMSPEQLRGTPADERSDVYALGATLYHLLARKPPHAAKSGDEMMKAAVAGPPTPIRDLAPGVAPELATIVDKALAFDVKQRYQDAGALAEDLQRFLAGQLVASHHYSAGEKFLRFVRRNRATVGVSAAALVALLVGGTIAIRRIVAERDRADRQARIAVAEKQDALAKKRLADERADQLTLTEARNLADANPTVAVAMVKPLGERLWRRVRSIAAAAQLQGVARGFPASPHTLSLELDAEGARALAAGSDGVVRLYDLAHGTSRMIADVKQPARASFAGDGRAVVYHDAQLSIVELDPRAGAPREVAAPTPIAQLVMSGPIAYWVDTAGALWTLDVANPTPQHIELDDKLDRVAPSPDGRWVALAGQRALFVLDRTQPTLPPESLLDGHARALAWSPDSEHLASLVGDNAVDYAVLSHTLAQMFMVGNRTAVAYAGNRLATAGPTGVALGSTDDAFSFKETGAFTLGLHEARGGMIVTAGPQGIVKVIAPAGGYTLHSPVPKLAALATSRNAPWVLAAADGVLLAWDLDRIQPVRVTTQPPSGAAFVDGDHAIVTYPEANAEWIELATGKRKSLGAIVPGLTAVVAAPHGERAVVFDGTHHARIYAQVGEPVDIEEDVDHAAIVDDQRIALATTHGAVRLDDGDVLVARRSPISALAANQGWVTAAYSDHTLWRTRVGGSEATLDLTAAPQRGALAIAPDGTVVFGEGNAVRAWHADGKLAHLGELAKPIVTIAAAEPDTFIAIASDGSTAVFGLEGKHADPAFVVAPSASASGDGMLATLGVAGILEAVDPLAQDRFTVATPRPGQAFSSVQIAPDGKRILAIAPDGLYTWTLALPHDPAETTRWLDAMTSAHADQGPRSLTW